MRHFLLPAVLAIVALVPAALAESPPKINPGTVAEDSLGTSDPGAAGASGPDTGGINISKGGIIGIAVGIAVAVVGIIAMWFLWYMAKKRSWDVRSSIRRASRRLTGGLTSSAKRKSSNRAAAARLTSTSPPRDRDVEKGLPQGSRSEKVQVVETRRGPREVQVKPGERSPQAWRTKMAADSQRSSR